MFWPKEIWGLYADSLADFKEPRNARQAVQCLNHMVTDALRYITRVLCTPNFNIGACCCSLMDDPACLCALTEPTPLYMTCK